MCLSIKVYNLLDDPFARFLPENGKYCTRKEINTLHKETCEFLEIGDIYPDLLWSFSKKLRHALAEAWWIDHDDGKKEWRIAYDTRYWVAMGAEGRKNTIIHEVCHLAVEKIYGHNEDARRGDLVETHGHQWQQLMRKCNQDPFMENLKLYY